MDRNRLMMMGALMAAIVVVVGGFFLGVQPQLSSARAAQMSAATVTTENEQLAGSLETLKSQYSKLDSLTSQLSKLKASVPDDVNSGAFITELNTVATSSGVSLTNIGFGTAAAYVAPVVSTPASSTTTATASPSASASATPTATPTPTASTPVSPTVATDPLITAANFTDIPVTVTVAGTYAQALSFLQGLRDGNRLFLVNTLTSASSSSTTGAAVQGGAIGTWTIGGLVYALTDAASAQQSQITGTSTAADSTTGSSSSTDTAAGK